MNALPEVPKPPLSGFVLNEEILSVSGSARKYLHTHYAKSLKIGIAIGTIYEILVIWFLAQQFLSGQLSNDSSLIFALLVPFVTYGIILVSIQTKIRHQFYRQFAQANSFIYQQKGWLDQETGALFSVGHSKTMEDIIQGEIAGVPISLFNYFFTVGHGKHSRAYQSTVWKLVFTSPMPPMLLLVDNHTFGDNLSDNNLRDVSKVDLGGELEKHFNLFAEKKFEIEALQIFSQDFLRLIYEKYRQFSLDFSGNKLYLYSNKIITTKEELLNLKEFALALLQKLNEKLPAMSGSITALFEALSKA